MKQIELPEIKEVKRHTARNIALAAVAVLLAAIIIFACVWYLGASYPDFDAVAEETDDEIPCLSEGISPQGLCLLPENDEGYTYAMSGYMVDGSYSRICLFGSDTAEDKYVYVRHGGALLSTHFGGITCTGDYLVVASGEELVRIPLKSVLSAQNGDAVFSYGSFSTGIGNAFCYCHDGKLYAGEFYRPGNYETDESHHLTVSGGTNYAFVYVYDVDESVYTGVSSTAPEKVISIPGLVQGFAIYGNTIALSASYGLASSHIYLYDATDILNDNFYSGTYIGGRYVPLYKLSASNLKEDIESPCMSEEICFSDNGTLYVLFESMCNKYKYGTRTHAKHIYALTLNV